MKPTKNRIFCYDCGHIKMLFETEKKADTFIKFNVDEIKNQRGYAPIRSYFCIACNGWHVTSKEEFQAKSLTETIINEYRKEEKAKDIQSIGGKSVKKK